MAHCPCMNLDWEDMFSFVKDPLSKLLTLSTWIFSKLRILVSCWHAVYLPNVKSKYPIKNVSLWNMMQFCDRALMKPHESFLNTYM